MSTLTAMESYLGWHITIMVLVWVVFLVRFNQTARGFLALCYDDSWDAQVLRWGIIIVLDLLIPAALAAPAFYYTSFVQPTGWITRTSAWIGYWGFFWVSTLMVMLRFSSPCGCCCGRHPSGNHIGGPPRRLHGHRPSLNRQRHGKPTSNSPQGADE